MSQDPTATSFCVENGEPTLYIADISGSAIIDAIEERWEELERYGIIKVSAYPFPPSPATPSQSDLTTFIQHNTSTTSDCPPSLPSPKRLNKRRLFALSAKTVSNPRFKTPTFLVHQQYSGNLVRVQSLNSTSDMTLSKYLASERDSTRAFNLPDLPTLREFVNPKEMERLLVEDKLFGEVPSHDLWSDEVCEKVEEALWEDKQCLERTLRYGKDSSELISSRNGENQLQAPPFGPFDDVLTKLSSDHEWEGINTFWGYYGSLASLAAYHIEDLNFLSINASYRGAPKIWYGIRMSDIEAFRSLMQRHGPDADLDCPQPWYHKELAVPPDVTEQAGIIPTRIVQRPGDIVVTFPMGYHQVLNLGFNYNEAVNFVAGGWAEGTTTFPSACSCLPDAVTSWSHMRQTLALKAVMP